VEILRIAAFSAGNMGGNPAAVVLGPTLPEQPVMQAVAGEVGYSETVFAAPHAGGWRVRYFSPAVEIPFCGHATIALAAALAARHGNGIFRLDLNDATITVEGQCTDGALAAALKSPPTTSGAAAEDVVASALDLFSYGPQDLDPRLPPAFVEAGARHLILALSSRSLLAAMRYDPKIGAELMRRWRLATISLVHSETASLFHARNAFSAGGVYEDPATGAAAAALGGYLRDLGWPHGGKIDIHQGDDMGTPCRLHADIPPATGSSIRVSGAARYLSELV
jgi:PhzF family phenazine biosynthesis protein